MALFATVKTYCVDSSTDEAAATGLKGRVAACFQQRLQAMALIQVDPETAHRSIAPFHEPLMGSGIDTDTLAAEDSGCKRADINNLPTRDP